MKWPLIPIKIIAPAKSAEIIFEPEDVVWHLTLDQVESNTGYIINKKKAPAGEAGNSTYVFDERNVLYSKLRTYLNKVVCPEESGIATTELIPLQPRPDLLERKYLAYYLRSKLFLSFASIAVAGVKMPRIIMEKFWNHQIPLPPLSEQRRIVEILDQADDLRKKRAEADEKAACILPALFYKMFGDPATNTKGWRRGLLGDVIVEAQYGTSIKADADRRGVAIIRMNNIDVAGRLDLTNLKYVILSEDEQRHYALEDGDLLFNRTNSKELVGKTGLWRGEIAAVAASYLIRVRVDPAQVRPEFIWAYMNSRFIKQVLFDKCRRAIGMANINAKELRSLPLIIPPIQLQEAFAASLEQGESLVAKDGSVSIKIERLFSALLHRAFTCDLTAKWREAHMRELLAEMEQQAKALNMKEIEE